MIATSDNARPITVLVADDSAFMRTAITRMVESDAGMRVIGTAEDGLLAVERVAELQPDVVTLDVEMPRLNGLEALRRIMKENPRPVIMVSSLTQEGAEATLEALDIGAFDYLSKSQSFASLDIVKIRDDLVAKIKAAAESCRYRARVARVTRTTQASERQDFQATPSIICLGTSTGGPKALQQILPMLPADLPVGILIVQHMPPGFTAPFARRLDHLCAISVCEAKAEDRVQPGVAYIAPAGSHMTVQRQGPTSLIRISQSPENTLHRPSVDVMMLSAAEAFHGLAMGVIMTGMGSDGALGMQAIARCGGLTVGQDEASCAVYGMPRVCAEWGVLRRVVPLQEIPRQVLQAIGYRARAAVR
jgi:two-component system, chemotaxis family, protein-glutamate methylesterase/glutaminase